MFSCSKKIYFKHVEIKPRQRRHGEAKEQPRERAASKWVTQLTFFIGEKSIERNVCIESFIYLQRSLKEGIDYTRHRRTLEIVDEEKSRCGKILYLEKFVRRVRHSQFSKFVLYKKGKYLLSLKIFKPLTARTYAAYSVVHYTATIAYLNRNVLWYTTNITGHWSKVSFMT